MACQTGHNCRGKSQGRGFGNPTADKKELQHGAVCFNKALGAVLVPREVVTEPWLVPIAYANSAIMYGAQILTGKEIASAKLGFTIAWVQFCQKVRTKQGDVIRSRSIINCGGIYGDVIDGMLGSGNGLKSALVRASLLCLRTRMTAVGVRNGDSTCANITDKG